VVFGWVWPPVPAWPFARRRARLRPTMRRPRLLGIRSQPPLTWKETDLTSEVLIRPDGGISFPLAGDLHPAGHTTAELTTMLEQRVRKLEPDAVVTVMVKAAVGNRVYVIGKVTRPGDFPLSRPTDVMQALSLAGGATPFADTNAIRVLRRNGERQVSIVFHYGEVERGRRLDQNILLQSGDTVVVP